MTVKHRDAARNLLRITRSFPAKSPGKVCSPAGRQSVNAGDTKAAVSTYSFIVGGALLAGGVAMIALGKPRGER